MTKELTPEELSELRDELAWVIGNGQYGLRTMHIVTRIPDLLNQLDTTQEKLANVEGRYHNCQDEFKQMEELANNHLEGKHRLYQKLAKYEAVVEAASAFVNVLDENDAGACYDELVSKVDELENLKDD